MTQLCIQRNIQLLIENGFSEIIINVSYLGDQIKEHVDEIFPKENISFSFEKKPLGTGGGVLKALPLLGNKSFMLIKNNLLIFFISILDTKTSIFGFISLILL